MTATMRAFVPMVAATVLSMMAIAQTPANVPTGPGAPATSPSPRMPAQQPRTNNQPNSGPANAGSANTGQAPVGLLGNPKPMAGLHSGSQLKPLPLQRNPRLSDRGIDLAVLSILTRQKQAADLQRTRLMAARDARTHGVGNVVHPDVSPTLPERDVLACARTAPAPLFAYINDAPGGRGVIFTTDPPTNSFIFHGCNFGEKPGKLELVGPSLKNPVPFQIEIWSEGYISGKVQPDLCGQPDEENARLRVTKSSGGSFEYAGFKLYTAREERKLFAVPRSKVQLGSWFDPCPSASECSYRTGLTPDYPTSIVERYSQSSAVATAMGTDHYTLDELETGFTVSAVQLSIQSLNSQGFTAIIGSNRLTPTVDVTFAFHDDLPYQPPPHDATYGIRIFIVGPRNCKPWQSPMPGDFKKVPK